MKRVLQIEDPVRDHIYRSAFEELPWEMYQEIASHLETFDILRLGLVNHYMQNIAPALVTKIGRSEWCVGHHTLSRCKNTRSLYNWELGIDASWFHNLSKLDCFYILLENLVELSRLKTLRCCTSNAWKTTQLTFPSITNLNLLHWGIIPPNLTRMFYNLETLTLTGESNDQRSMDIVRAQRSETHRLKHLQFIEGTAEYPIVDCPHLESLVLFNCVGTFRNMAGYQSLKVLCMYSYDLTYPHMETILEFPSLDSLCIREATWLHGKSFPRLQELHCTLIRGCDMGSIVNMMGHLQHIHTAICLDQFAPQKVTCNVTVDECTYSMPTKYCICGRKLWKHY
jgi:hypothetical protein